MTRTATKTAKPATQRFDWKTERFVLVTSRGGMESYTYGNTLEDARAEANKTARALGWPVTGEAVWERTNAPRVETRRGWFHVYAQRG